MENSWIAFPILFTILFFAAMIIWGVQVGKRAGEELHTKIDYFNSIQIGDSKELVLEKFGSNYSRQLLKNGVEKYTWTLQVAQSFGHSYKGVSSRVYSGVKKVYIKFKDGKVIETNGINLGQ